MRKIVFQITGFKTSFGNGLNPKCTAMIMNLYKVVFTKGSE